MGNSTSSPPASLTKRTNLHDPIKCEQSLRQHQPNRSNGLREFRTKIIQQRLERRVRREERKEKIEKLRKIWFPNYEKNSQVHVAPEDDDVTLDDVTVATTTSALIVQL